MVKCKKCGEDIPNRVEIDGKSRVLCSRSYCLTCSPFGLHNTKDLTKGRNNSWQIRSRRRKKQQAVEYLGGKCCLCGYNKCLSALEFHHTSDKKIDPTRVIHQWSWERIKVEIDKCILVCSNCHREIHYGFYQTEELKRLRVDPVEVKCMVCNKLFDTKNKEQVYCSQTCVQKANRKVVRPSKEELQQDLKEIGNWTVVGIKYGVTDNAVRKWARAYGILKSEFKRKHVQGKKVRMIYEGSEKIYNTIGEASRELNISHSSISGACSGKYKTAGGYRCEYV